MKLQAWLLVPVTAGIVVALMAVTIQILSGMQGLYEKLQNTSGGLNNLGMQVMTKFIDFQKLVGPWVFQITLGVYLIETVMMLSIFKNMQNLLKSAKHSNLERISKRFLKTTWS